MWLSILVLAAWALCPVLGNSNGLPACANDCLTSALPGSSCSPDDTSCICHDDLLQQNLTQCVTAHCMPKEQLVARNITDTMCHIPVRDNTAIDRNISTGFGIPAILSTIIRFAKPVRSYGLEDAFLLLSLVTAIIVGGLGYPVSLEGFGKDIWHVSFSNITKILKLSYVIQIFYVITTSSYKMVFLCLYYSVFRISKLLRWAIISLVIFISLDCFIFLFLVIFHCWPVSYTWTFWSGETEGKCLNFNAIAFAQALINVVIDVMILLLPLHQISGLQLKRSRKILVLAMFSTGSIVIIVSLIRLHTLATFSNSLNFTWNNVGTAYWSTIESFTAVFCVNIPSIRTLIIKIMTRFDIGSYGKSTDKVQSHDYPRNQPSNQDSHNMVIMETLSVSVRHGTPDGSQDTHSQVELIDDGPFEKGPFDKTGRVFGT